MCVRQNIFICWFTPQIPRSQKHNPGSHTCWASQTHCLGPHLLLPIMHISRTVKSSTETGLEPRYSDGLSRCPNQQYNHCVKHLPQLSDGWCVIGVLRAQQDKQRSLHRKVSGKLKSIISHKALEHTQQVVNTAGILAKENGFYMLEVSKSENKRPNSNKFIPRKSNLKGLKAGRTCGSPKTTTQRLPFPQSTHRRPRGIQT